MKCGRISCNKNGRYQPLIRIKAAVMPADGKDVLAMIRLPFVVCLTCRISTSVAEIIAAVPKARMDQILVDAKVRTGASPNPDRTDVFWVRITGVN